MATPVRVSRSDVSGDFVFAERRAEAAANTDSLHIHIYTTGTPHWTKDIHAIRYYHDIRHELEHLPEKAGISVRQLDSRPVKQLRLQA